MVLDKRAQWRMVVAAVVVTALSAAQQSAYAQANAESRGKDIQGTRKTKTGHRATPAAKKVLPGKPHRKGPAIPKPTVVLHPGEAPIIKFESAVYEFGRVRAGTPVKHDFVFTNSGNGTLEILKAKAG